MCEGKVDGVMIPHFRLRISVRKHRVSTIAQDIFMAQGRGSFHILSMVNYVGNVMVLE